ncbi:MAG: MBOAT family O-acyltransferase [Acidobacteriota bacterium]
MLFNSTAFLIFLPLVLGVYYALPVRGKRPWLLLASNYFYGSWDWRFLSLLWISILLDYYCARGMEGASPRRRNALLATSVSGQLLILGFFKYYGFFVDSLRVLLDTAGLGGLAPRAFSIVLPVGISFYTFQTMSYTIDVWRGAMAPARSLVDFALFVSYFPQLVAGPIERATHLLPQILAPRPVTIGDVRSAAVWILTGLFKKVVVGDTLTAPYVEAAFADPAHHGGGALFWALCLFSIQIYADFCGYSEVAVGASKLLGIDLTSNFRQPYLAHTITEFWRRWHVTLSTWLRDYLYISLGGNRRGRIATYRNLMMTMLLGGLWHGASWTFVIWGGLHGIFLAGHKLLLGGKKPDAVRPSRWRLVPGIVATNLLVLATWIFFRARDLRTAVLYLRGLAGSLVDPAQIVLVLAGLCAYLAFVAVMDLVPYLRARDDLIERLPAALRVCALATLAIVVWNCWPQAYAPFIYFQF